MDFDYSIIVSIIIISYPCYVCKHTHTYSFKFPFTLYAYIHILFGCTKKSTHIIFPFSFFFIIKSYAVDMTAIPNVVQHIRLHVLNVTLTLTHLSISMVFHGYVALLCSYFSCLFFPLLKKHLFLYSTFCCCCCCFFGLILVLLEIISPLLLLKSNLKYDYKLRHGTQDTATSGLFELVAVVIIKT